MNQSKRSAKPSELESLADYLLEKQDLILAKWEKNIKEETGEQTSTLISFSRSKFYNSIPELLKRICGSLHDGGMSIKEIARNHGSQRWNHGLDLRELINEWSLLHLTLIDQINQSREFVSISSSTLAEAQSQLARQIYTGIKASVDKYHELQRLKEESKMRDLEAIVQEQGDQKTQRGENLQEASHDLKGSMTAIRMNLFLLQKADLSDRARQLVKRLSLSTDSLTQMLKNLLDLSRLEAGREQLKISEFDAAGALYGLGESLQPMADAEGIELRMTGEETLRVRGDRMKMLRIAQNLLMNALKYTEAGYAELKWEAKSTGHWQLIVRDTGPGIDSTSAALFANTSEKKSPQQSFTAGKDHDTDEAELHSEGIGLSIVRQLCRLLDAVLEIESEPGVGTTVRVEFPMDYARD